MSSRSTLKVIVFPGGFNLPIWVAQEQGYFDRQGLRVELTFTSGSVYQMTHLIRGEFDIAHTAMDNVIAYDEGQGEILLDWSPDVVAFMGGDNGFLRLITQSELLTYADLKGKRLSVDALTTGYAFVLRKMLEANDLEENDYDLIPTGGIRERWQALLNSEHAGSLLITPFEILARQQGFHLLDNGIDVLGSYQGVVGATRRSWASVHGVELVGYIRAYITALNWLYQPSNRETALNILAKNTQLSATILLEAYATLVNPIGGFALTAGIDFAGVQSVLDLRNNYANLHKNLGDPNKYLALEYYERALS